MFLWLAMLCFCAMLGIGHQAEAKADRYFIDCENNTGYYVDVNSIEVPSDHEVLLDLYLIKPHGGYIYRYETYFDTAEGSYEYRQSKVYNYETKKLVTGNSFLQNKLSYHKSKTLEQVVDFALEWKRSHIHKTPYGETWE